MKKLAVPMLALALLAPTTLGQSYRFTDSDGAVITYDHELCTFTVNDNVRDTSDCEHSYTFTAGTIEISYNHELCTLTTIEAGVRSNFPISACEQSYKFITSVSIGKGEFTYGHDSCTASFIQNSVLYNFPAFDCQEFLRPPTRPQTPQGLEVIGGLGTNFLTWENPYQIYDNHARTNIYRNIVDQFDGATEIGRSNYSTYNDEDVESNHTYFYWIRWENTDGTLSAQSESVEVQTATDPAEFRRELLDWLENDPLVADLSSPIQLDFPSWLIQEFPNSAEFSPELVEEARLLAAEVESAASYARRLAAEAVAAATEAKERARDFLKLAQGG